MSQSSIYETLSILIPVDCTIIEIGAHIGTDTEKLYYHLAPSEYYAIEPDERNISALVSLRLPIKIIKSAIGNINGEVDFWYSSGQTPHNRLHTDSNSLLKPITNSNRPKWVTFEQGKVLCNRLDDLLPYVRGIDLIWMDIQGAELLAIEGGQKVFSRAKYLYTECQEGRYYNQPGLDGILQALPGWELVFKVGDNVLLRNKERI